MSRLLRHGVAVLSCLCLLLVAAAQAQQSPKSTQPSQTPQAGKEQPAPRPLKPGDLVPALELAAPDSPKAAKYLGVPEKKPFALAQVDAPFVLLQVFSMYCPHCQREAPHIKAMFETLQAKGVGKQLKVLGVGVGNSEYEAAFFRDKYAIPFPLLQDPQFAVYNATGSVGTPYYVLARREKKGLVVLFTQEGAFDDAGKFLATLLEKTGLTAK